MDKIMKKNVKLVTSVFELQNMSTKIPFLVWPLTVERKGKKRQSIKFLKNKKSFLEETKIIFHDFWNAFIWQNKKK